jgi:hypothetical protein
LKKKYGDKEIAGVTESSSDDEVSFVINIKDAKHWYIVKTDVCETPNTQINIKELINKSFGVLAESLCFKMSR